MFEPLLVGSNEVFGDFGSEIEMDAVFQGKRACVGPDFLDHGSQRALLEVEQQSFPASMRARSRTSLMRSRRCFPARWMKSASFSAWTGSLSARTRSWLKPRGSH